MVKFICDCCNKTIETADRFHVSDIDTSANLCRECFKGFLNWMKDKFENYERLDCDYKEHIMLL